MGDINRIVVRGTYTPSAQNFPTFDRPGWSQKKNGKIDFRKINTFLSRYARIKNNTTLIIYLPHPPNKYATGLIRSRVKQHDGATTFFSAHFFLLVTTDDPVQGRAQGEG